jgi:hypothetical protein
MMLCLSFGGKPCPSEWGAILESIYDLATAILHSNDWDPNKMYAPNQHLVPNKSLSMRISLLGRERSWLSISPLTPAERMTFTLMTSSALLSTSLGQTMLLEAKQLPSLPLTPPLAQTTQANPFLKKAWMQETSCWQRQACQKRRSFWDGFLILGNYKYPSLKTSSSPGWQMSAS